MARALVALVVLFAVAPLPARGAEQEAPSAAASAAAWQPPFAFDGPPAPVPPAVVSRDGEGRVTVRAVRLEAPLRIDGALDEPLYRDVPPIAGFVQVEPEAGTPASERTDVWIAFDADHIYVSFRSWDGHPERRVASDMRRDSPAIWRGDDVVSVFLDTFYDRRNGVVFTLNSIGGRNDGQVTNERQYSGDWNPVWDFAVGRFEGGWTLEMAIPFKSLRYRGGASQIWGLNLMRTVRSRNEISLLAPVPPGRGQQGVMQASLAATLVGLVAPPASRSVDVKPYAISSLTRDAAADPAAALDGDIGLDVRYGLTPNLAADLTYNTDFAQVEADEAQVNLTRFSLFFPEKREFFLENQGIFSFGGVATAGQLAGGEDTPILFYSRRIGLEQGRPVPIRAGARLTGRAGPYSLGLLNISTGDAPAIGAGAANFSVVRLKRDVLRRSSVGVLFTGRSAAERGPGANTAVGMDGTFGFFNDLTVNTYWARTRTGGLDGGDTSYRAQLDYNGDRYGLEVDHLLVGRHFNPEVGFLRRPDMRRSFGFARYSPRPHRLASVRRFAWIGALAYIENTAGRLETRTQDAEFAIEFENSDRFSVGYTRTYEFLPRPFDIAPGVTLPVGGYDFGLVRVAWELAQQRRVSGSLLLERGTFFSGRRTTIGASRGRLNLTPQLSVEPTYSINLVDLAEGAFTTHLAGSRVTFTATPRMFASALLQYSSAADLVMANVRMRWEYRPGSELFVVYNEERDVRAGAFPVLANRAFIVKVNRLLRF